MIITTLTLNPALDKSAKVDGMIATKKLKCEDVKYEPGGGGINVSRMLSRLGIKANCVLPIGGDNGKQLSQILEKEGVESIAVEVKNWTRENLAIMDKQTKLQFRFGMPGHELSEAELTQIKDRVEQMISKGDMLVMSGSLPPGLPKDYYVGLIRHFNKLGIKVVLDTAGAALSEAIKEPVFLLKPNQRELAEMAGKDFLTSAEQESFAMNLIQKGKAEIVVVSLGSRGAFIVSKEGIAYQSTPSVAVQSTIGAGDSMVAGLIYGIHNQLPSEEILKWGVACGVATSVSRGTSLSSNDDVKKVFDML